MKNTHQWKEQARGTAKRMSIGLVASFSITLIAFEWTSYGPLPIVPEPWEVTDPPWEVPPIIRFKQEQAKEERKAKEPEKKSTSGPIEVIDEPVTDPDPTIEPTTEIDPIGSSPEPMLDTSTVAPKGMTMPVLNPEILPYFDSCLRSNSDRTKECTEEKILRHLERRLRIPGDLKGSIRTTVTFEIDAEGSIGRIHCAPRVDPAIEQEIGQVIRSLPQFVPGSQGGHAVAVYYQIPLLLTRN